MKLSIITPVWLDSQKRINLFQRCLGSIEKQDFPHDQFEHVIVNDGSPLPFEFPSYPWLRVVNQPNLNRITALNTGFKNARGDIFCLLDSDDEYEFNYLQKVSEMFQNYPEYKMFNFGNIYVYPDGTTAKREAFKPKELEVGHEVFGGGNIVNGTFVFHREIYDKLGAFPEGQKEIIVDWYRRGPLMWTSPYDFAAYAYNEFPELRPFFVANHPDHPKGLIKEMGNPWGNDFYLFYKYTRKYHSKPIDEYLYIVNQKL